MLWSVLEAESWGWSAEPSASYLPLGQEPRLQLVGVVGLNVEFLELDSSRNSATAQLRSDIDNKTLDDEDIASSDQVPRQQSICARDKLLSPLAQSRSPLLRASANPPANKARSHNGTRQVSLPSGQFPLPRTAFETAHAFARSRADPLAHTRRFQRRRADTPVTRCS